MNFESFKEMVKENVSRKLGDGYCVTINEVNKNNGIILSGLTIKHDNTNVAPTVYLDEYYEKYRNGECTIYAVVSNILKIYKENKLSKPVNMKFFLDFDYVRPYIAHKLVNTERNKKLLTDIPHVDFLDLSVIFMILIPESINNNGMASITITNSHCKVWEVGTDELIFAARQNTSKLMPLTITSMNEMLKKSGITDSELLSDAYDSIMFVLTNKYGLYGASAMLDKNYLRDLSDVFGNSYYILPSSIHELIILPDTGELNSNELKDMVKTVNRTEVNPAEVLSDSVYYFNRENDKLLVL